MNELVKVLPNFRKFNDYIKNVKNNVYILAKKEYYRKVL